MTSVISKIEFSGGVQMNLRVNTTDNVLHAFVNKKHVGSEWCKQGSSQFVFDKPVRLKAGNNQISLLSATVGLANYGPFFDLKPTGIAGGPVKLAGARDVSITKCSNESRHDMVQGHFPSSFRERSSGCRLEWNGQRPCLGEWAQYWMILAFIYG